LIKRKITPKKTKEVKRIKTEIKKKNKKKSTKIKNNNHKLKFCLKLKKTGRTC
jgi:hypothetical protein